MWEELKKNVEQKMGKTVDSFKSELLKIRTGRAHIGILDHIKVSYYETLTPISQLANISVADSRTLYVQPFEKHLISTIEKAIRESKLDLNPSTQGELIRIPMPSLTEERRRDLVKLVRTTAETSKVALRNIRREANDALKNALKNKIITEDVEKRVQNDVQKMLDKAINDVDKLVQAKEAELTTI